MLDVAVSLVVYKTKPEDLLPLVDSIVTTTLKIVFDVVDNFGDPQLESFCALHKLNYQASGRNLGFGAGHNEALRKRLGSAKYHLVVNPDIRFEPSGLEVLTRFLDDNPDVGQVMPRVLYPDGRIQLLSKLLPNPFLLIVRRFFPAFLDHLFVAMEQRYELQQAPLEQIVEAPNLSGCFMLLRGSVLAKVGLFDPRYFMYLEDVDLTRRIAQVSRTVCNPSVAVSHDFNKGSYKNSRLLVIHIRSAIRYFNKWGWFRDTERTRINRVTVNRLKPSKTLRVLHVYKTFYPDSYGGVEQAISELCHGNYGQATIAEVFTLSHRVPHTEVLVHQGIRIHRVPVAIEVASTPFSWAAFREFRRLQREFDLIHLHFPWPFADLFFFFSGSRKPMIVTYHSDIIKQRALKYLYEPLMRAMLWRSQAIVPTSPNYLKTSLPLTQYRSKAHPIPLGVDEKRYPVPNAGKVAAYQAAWGSSYLSFVGVFRYYKGLRYLIEAAPQIRANLVLIGNGPEMQNMRELVEKSAARNVVFLGALNDQDKVDVLAGSLGFVFPSIYRSEAFGLGLVEAAMLAKPLVSCEIGTGTSYINLDGETGYVVAPFSSSALAEAANRLVDDPVRARMLGQNARLRYEHQFTASSMVAQYHDLYRKVLLESR